eukprot:scaffold60659_cov57-Phaeocystis_antarctica.AAC.4
MQLVRGNDRACGAAVGVRSLQIRRVTRPGAFRKNCPRLLKCDLRFAQPFMHAQPPGQGRAQIKRCPYYKY